jgi:hypothetical protein
MLLPGFYPTPEPMATWTTPAERIIQATAAKAEATTPGFHEAAKAFVLAYLDTHGPTAGEALTLAATAAGVTPGTDDRAFGAVYHALSRRGYICQSGWTNRERGHGTAGGRIWAISDAGRAALSSSVEAR